jgi:tetratricopeptide (TPR) repeat protein
MRWDRGVDHRRIALPSAPAPLDERLAGGGAIAWSEPVTIRTYEAGEPDRYPMFLERRVYQGSSGRVYPMPFVDSVEGEPSPRRWQAVHLENRWLRLMVLPELGGRIHLGYDKVADYDFFYRNNVIKPALVGLDGPWISGGVEFNWPQHHRPATYLPVEAEVEEGADGSVTVWCSDHDPFARMKGMHGVRLHPDRAAVELVVRLHNRTSETQTFLWWANVAAAVHDDYQAFFPTDVRYVAYPARAVDGGDRIDLYRNIPVPTSYMVTDTVDDFFGGYDHRAQAGFVHVADRHIAPGKKLWTWGDSPFGHAWDRLLTDDDGPYVELMAGVYTDNQPDFAWLEPGETKSFSQTWFPIQRMGPAHQANADAAVRLEVVDGEARLGLCVTASHPGAVVEVVVAGRTALRRTVDLAPGDPLLLNVPARGAEPTEVEVSVRVQDGAELIRWRPRPASRGAEPWTASAPPSPEDVATIEELFLTGVHLAQYRHPSRSPEPYWQEALRRDPGDARTHVALARDRYHRADYAEAASHARRALRRLTTRNGNPRDGEASYLLGLALLRMGESDAARDALAKAGWDGRWVGPAELELARLDARCGMWAEALRRSLLALEATPGDSRAEVVRVVALRALDVTDQAEEALGSWLARDPLDQTARYLAGRSTTRDGRTMLDIALELRAAGAAQQAMGMLDEAAVAVPSPAGEVRPIAHYHRAALLDVLGRPEEARDARDEARAVDATRCFPAGLDDHDALRAALVADPDDTRAQTLLGMLLFDAHREREALGLWTSALDRGLRDAVTMRNAAIAAVNLDGDGARARELYDRALVLDPTARLLFERDQLLARLGTVPRERLALLDPERPEVLRRDDLTVGYCRLLAEEGRGLEALAILESRRFAPWEGGEGQTVRAWEEVLARLSAEAEARGDLESAARYARRAIELPEGLGEVRHPLTDTTELHERLAALLDRLGRSEEASEVRASAVVSATAPVAASLDADEVDYFATSLPDLLLFQGKARGVR